MKIGKKVIIAISLIALAYATKKIWDDFNKFDFKYYCWYIDIYIFI